MTPRVIAAAILLLAASAPAEARYACAVKPTKDGFVALRDGPSARHNQLARMRPHEMVGLLHPDRDDIVRQGDWLFVRWHPGTRRTADSIPKVAESAGRPGWVRDVLIDCFEE